METKIALGCAAAFAVAITYDVLKTWWKTQSRKYKLIDLRQFGDKSGKLVAVTSWNELIHAYKELNAEIERIHLYFPSGSRVILEGEGAVPFDIIANEQVIYAGSSNEKFVDVQLLRHVEHQELENSSRLFCQLVELTASRLIPHLTPEQQQQLTDSDNLKQVATEMTKKYVTINDLLTAAFSQSTK